MQIHFPCNGHREVLPRRDGSVEEADLVIAYAAVAERGLVGYVFETNPPY
jgi:hypothetical protein